MRSVLRDVDLAVPPSSVVALLGPNGAGKTTLLRAASGLLPVWAGAIVLDDVDVTHRPAARAGGGGDLPRARRARGVPRALGAGEPAAAGEAGPGDGGPGPGDVSLPGPGTTPRPAGRHVERRRAADAGAVPGVRVDSRNWSSSTRCRWVSPPRSSTRSSSFLERLKGEGVSLLLVEQYVTRGPRPGRLRLPAAQGRGHFRGEPSELDHADVFREYLGGVSRQRSTA